MADKRRVYVISALARQAAQRLAPLREAGLDVIERYDLNSSRDVGLLSRELASAWATVAGSEAYPRPLFAALPGLRAIARCGVGYDAIDLEAASAHGVAVMTTPAANADGVADHALALMLACQRRVIDLDRAVRQGSWRPDDLTGDLSDAVVGIVGFGPIGRAVARRLSGFGCRILAADPYVDPALCAMLGVELTTLAALLPQVDILSVHAPLTQTTRHLIAARELALLKPSAIVVNNSRGGVVDQGALAAALVAGALAGAGLDVFESEPPAPDDPILSAPNLVLSPHAAGFSRGAALATLDMVARNLLAVLAGEVPASCINRDALAARAA